MSQPPSRYQPEFYSSRREGTLYSARIILSLLRRYLTFQNAVDVGCGTGTWLCVAKELGASTIVGYEGSWVNRQLLDDETMNLVSINLDTQLPQHSNTFDLVLCLEVAEHIEPARATEFVGALCRLGRHIMFSAAIPNQGGTNHINEQWQSYWQAIFKANGYGCLDLVRPHIWDDSKIPYYYRQNILLYAPEWRVRELQNTQDLSQIFIPDVVHPVLLKMKYDEMIRARQKAKSRRFGFKNFFACTFKRMFRVSD